MTLPTWWIERRMSQMPDLGAERALLESDDDWREFVGNAKRACPRCGDPGYDDILGLRFCGNPGCLHTAELRS